MLALTQSLGTYGTQAHSVPGNTYLPLFRFTSIDSELFLIAKIFDYSYSDIAAAANLLGNIIYIEGKYIIDVDELVLDGMYITGYEIRKGTIILPSIYEKLEKLNAVAIEYTGDYFLLDNPGNTYGPFLSKL